jgi:nickel/cobalt transporter (NicO) family protein
MPAGKNPLGLWALTAVGASGGLVPCPAALTALLAAVSLGRPATGVAVVGAMSLGIAATLIAIGILFVEAGRVASRVFGARALPVYVPRGSAVLITLLGLGLLFRSLTQPH